MRVLDPSVPIDFDCPNCGHHVEQTVGGLQHNSNCPGCGALFDTTEFVRGVEQVEQTIDDFVAKISHTIA